MSERKVLLVKHHFDKFIPSLPQSGVDEEYVFYTYGVASEDYPFLWNPGRAADFTSRINEANRAYHEGRAVRISERKKSKDHICQGCGNLENGKCTLERKRISCSF